MKMLRGLAAVAVAMAAAGAASAAQLIVTNGVLMGATGVTVGANTYDVTFIDGTCAQVFGTCETSSLDFKTLTDAKSAAQALLDQVLIDGPDGNFDSVITNINGGGNTGRMDVFVPYAVLSSVSFAYAKNYSGATIDSVASSSVSTAYDTAAMNNNTFARFALSAVPEPASWAMMLAGFGMMGGAMRRRRTAITFS